MTIMMIQSVGKIQVWHTREKSANAKTFFYDNILQLHPLFPCMLSKKK